MTERQQSPLASAGSTAGFTIIEMLVSVGMMLIVLGGVHSFYHSQLYVLRAQEVRVDVKQSADIALEFMVRELRMAGARPQIYPPLCLLTAPIPPLVLHLPPCFGFERFTDARQNAITLQYDFRGNAVGSAADGCPDDGNERVTYTFAAGSGEIQRTLNGEPTETLIGNVPPGGLVFRYFRANGTELVPGAGGLTTAQRADVHRIDVGVTVNAPHPDPTVGGLITATQRSVVLVRNPPC